MDEKVWDSCNMLTFSINTFSSRHLCNQFSMPTLQHRLYKTSGCIRLEPSFLINIPTLQASLQGMVTWNNYFNWWLEISPVFPNATNILNVSLFLKSYLQENNVFRKMWSRQYTYSYISKRYHYSLDWLTYVSQRLM